jgi:cell division septal protein FtsQ
MMERYKKLDPGLPERIVRMAEKSMDRADKELDILAQNMSRRQHEAETMRIAIEKGSKYDFRAQIIILVMVIVVLGVAVLLGLLGLSNIAYFVVAGGFATIITAAIKGVSNKTKP